MKKYLLSFLLLVLCCSCDWSSQMINKISGHDETNEGGCSNVYSEEHPPIQKR